MSQPLFVLVNDGDNNLTLMARLPGDRDFFAWGSIDSDQEGILRECGVFDLTGPGPDDCCDGSSGCPADQHIEGCYLYLPDGGR